MSNRGRGVLLLCRAPRSSVLLNPKGPHSHRSCGASGAGTGEWGSKLGREAAFWVGLLLGPTPYIDRVLPVCWVRLVVVPLKPKGPHAQESDCGACWGEGSGDASWAVEKFLGLTADRVSAPYRCRVLHVRWVRLVAAPLNPKGPHAQEPIAVHVGRGGMGV